MPIISVQDVCYEYTQLDETELMALQGVSFDVRQGEFVCMIGHNGSGKSTMAKLLNGLFTPSSGQILIKDMNTADENLRWNIRQSAGLVFQNPDNQLVATIVEEDVAFGPENLGVPPAEIRTRVDAALESVGMSAYAHSEPHKLSGGQKQRVAIAGVLAMQPDILILDEPTAMLDPQGREEVMRTVTRLNKERGMTVVHITHFMEEALLADRILVMSEGKLVMGGTPLEIFARVEELKALGLDIPEVIELNYLLREQGIELPAGIINADKMVEALCRLL